MPFQINTTIHKQNAGEIIGIAELAKRLGAICFNTFMLVPTGRAAGNGRRRSRPDSVRIYPQRASAHKIKKRNRCPRHLRTRVCQDLRAGKGAGDLSPKATDVWEAKGSASLASKATSRPADSSISRRATSLITAITSRKSGANRIPQ